MNRMKLVASAGLLVVSVLGSPTVIAGPTNYETLVKQVKEAARYNLKDPSSAQFRNVVVTQSYHADTGALNGVNVCGEINAKNSFGAYTGFKKFFATRAEGKVVFVTEDDNIVFPIVYNPKQCGTVLKQFD
jgi:hypothetical protein